MDVAIRTSKERFGYRAVAVQLREGFVEYADADITVTAGNRADALRLAKAEAVAKGCTVVPQHAL